MSACAPMSNACFAIRIAMGPADRICCAMERALGNEDPCTAWFTIPVRRIAMAFGSVYKEPLRNQTVMDRETPTIVVCAGIIQYTAREDEFLGLAEADQAREALSATSPARIHQ